MTLLRIDSSAQNDDSITRQVTDYLVQRLNHGNVVSRDLAEHKFPAQNGDDVMAVYSGSSDPQYRQHLAWSGVLTEELLAAQTLVIGVPMYNFGVPTYLKQWIDYVCRAGITFSYTDKGPVGLTPIDDAYIVTATGGTPVGSDMDFASRYVEQVCRFLGAQHIHHIDAGGSKRDTVATLENARRQVDVLLGQQAA